MGKKALSVLKLMVLAGILIGIPAYLLLFHLDEIRSLETIDEALDEAAYALRTGERSPKQGELGL